MHQFIVYLLVGAASAVVDIGVLWLLLGAGALRAAAVGAALLTGMVVNYLMHRRVTFRAQAPVDLRSLLLYVSIVVVNYLITLAFVEAGVWMGYGAIAAKLVSLPMIALTGFLFTRRFVFL